MPSGGHQAADPDTGSDLSPAYVRVLVIEVVVLVVLFWVGRVFG